MPHRTLAAAVTAAALTAAAAAQEIDFDAGATAVRLPLVMLSNGYCAGLPCVDARVDGSEAEVLLLLDTGFNQFALDRAFADEIELVQSGSDVLIGIGGAGKRPLYRAPAVRLGGATFRDRIAYGLPLDGFCSGRHRRIQGILGGTLFGKCVVTIDYRASEVVLHDPEEYEAPADALEVSLEFAIGQPELRASIDGGDAFRFLVDTGAEPHLMINAPFAARRGALDDSERLAVSNLGGLAGGSSRTFAGEVGRLALGGLDIEAVPTLLFAPTDQVALAGDQRRAGTVGSGLFARARVTFDYRRRLLLIEHGGDAFDRLYLSGISLNRDTAGTLTVREALTCPGREAPDVAAGDVLIAIDGRDPPTDGRAIYDLICGRERTRLTIERDGERREVAWPRIDAMPRIRFDAKR